jgi:long-chain fatty acid transport protein
MKKIFYALMIALTTATDGYGACIDTYGIGSKATSMGGAYSAYADDPFAAYYNPAGLTQIERPTFAAGVHMIDPSIDIKNFYIEDHPDPGLPGENSKVNFSDDSDNLYAPFTGYAMSATDRLAIGIAAYAPYGLKLDWEDDPQKNPGAYNYYHSYYDRVAVTPTVAYKITEKFSLGVGVSIGKSEAGAEKRYYITPNVMSIPGMDQYAAKVDATMAAVGQSTTSQAAAVYKQLVAANPDNIQYQQAYGLTQGLSQMGVETSSALNGTAPIDHNSALKVELEDDVNYSYNIGLMYKPAETISLGLTYRSEADSDFDGDAYINRIRVSGAELEYNTPQQIQAGVRYMPNNQLSLEMDLVWTDWSIHENQVETLDTPVSLQILPGLNSNPVSILENDRDWEDTRQIRFGAEYLLNDIVALRCGYFYDPTPIPDHTLDLQWPDADKKTYSIGAGFNFNPISIDTVIQYTDIEKDREIGGESENFNHSYSDHDVHAKAGGDLFGAGMTFSYRF